MKADHILQAIISISGGVLSYAMGGFDLLLKTMLALTIIDFMTGTGQAIYHGKFKAMESAKGTIRKVYVSDGSAGSYHSTLFRRQHTNSRNRDSVLHHL